jgi:hypothetical protein
MYLITKIFMTLEAIYYILVIINTFKGTSPKKEKLIVLNIIQCSLLITITKTLEDIVKILF